MNTEILLEAMLLKNQLIALSDQVRATEWQLEGMKGNKRELQLKLADNAEKMLMDYQRRSS